MDTLNERESNNRYMCEPESLMIMIIRIMVIIIGIIFIIRNNANFGNNNSNLSIAKIIMI